MKEQNLVWENETYEQLEPGVKDLVKTLHLCGIRTFMSCEGHIPNAIYIGIHTGIKPWPWIILVDKTKKIDKLQTKLNKWNKKYPVEKWLLSQERIHGSITREHIQFFNKNKPDMTITALTPEETNWKYSLNVLNNLQQQSKILATFLTQSR